MTDTASISLPKIVRVIPRNRNIEFLLLLFAVGLYAFELAQIQLSVLEILTPELLMYWVPPTLFAFAIHFILRRRASEADPMILPIAVVLNTLGLSMIYRLDLGTIANSGTELFGVKQIVWTMIAMAVAAMRRDDLVALVERGTHADRHRHLRPVGFLRQFQHIRRHRVRRPGRARGCRPSGW